MARILFVTPYPVSRIRTRSYGFVENLLKYHTVTVLALCTGEKDMADMWALQHEGLTITTVQEKRFQQYLRSVCAMGSRLPFQVAFGAAPGLRRAINAHLLSRRFDLLHVESMRALGALPAILDVPVIWDAVDCISQLYEQGAYFGATSMMRFIGHYEAQRTRAYEYAQIQRFRHVLVTSERDRQALLGLGKGIDIMQEKTMAEVEVIPHGIDQQYFQRYSGPRQREMLVFSGKMSFHANIAGALNLVEHIMPRIWKDRPHVRLVIAGSNPPFKIRRLACDPRVQVTGYVPDLRPYIARAQVAVSPLPYAVGIQNKVLEAMALGTPVVASSCASAGLQAVAGRDLLIADEPEAFVDAVLRLLEDQRLWNSLVEGGLAYISAHHNWVSILRRLNTIYAQAMGRTHAGETLSM